MKSILFFSVPFISVLSAYVFQNFLKNEKVRKILFFIILFLLTVCIRKTALADSWLTGKAYGSFNISDDEITFIQDDDNYYFVFDFSHNSYGAVSNTGYILSQSPSLGYMQESSSTGSAGVSRTCLYYSSAGGTYYGTTYISSTNSGSTTLHETPSIYIFDNAVRSEGISPSKTFVSDVHNSSIKIDNVNKSCAKVPKSKINYFRYLNARSTRNTASSGKNSYAMSNAYDLMTLTSHECDFKPRYIDAEHHDYYCSICHWGKGLEEHTFDKADAFGYENHKCVCGLHNKSTIRFKQENSEGSSGDNNISYVDIIGTPGDELDLTDYMGSGGGFEKEGYVFVGFDPEPPSKFPDESIEYKILYRPIKYKILFSTENNLKLNNQILSSLLISKQSARSITEEDIEKIKSETGTSINNCNMIIDAVYDEEFYLPTYGNNEVIFFGWTDVREASHGKYKTGVKIKNLTSTENKIIILYPALYDKQAHVSGGESNYQNEPIGNRENGNSGIIHHGSDTGGPGGGGSSGGGGGGSSGGASEESKVNNNNIDNETKEDEKDKTDDESKSIEETNATEETEDKENKKENEDETSAENQDETSAEDETLEEENKDDETENEENENEETEEDETEDDENKNLILDAHQSGNDRGGGILDFFSDITFASTLKEHLSSEFLWAKMEKLKNISVLKSVLSKMFYFLILLLVVLHSRDRKHKRKVQKCV